MDGCEQYYILALFKVYDDNWSGKYRGASGLDKAHDYAYLGRALMFGVSRKLPRYR